MTIADLGQSSFPAAFAFGLGGPCHCYIRVSDSVLMKDYLQPAATVALALSIASLPFTLPRIAEAQVNKTWDGEPGYPIHVKVVSGCR